MSKSAIILGATGLTGSLILEQLLSNDAYNSVKVWKDENSDGISQEHELYSLIDLGVDSIDLNSTEISEDNQGNTAGLRSTWTDASGETHDVDDVWFSRESDSNNVLDLSDLLDSEDVEMDELDHYLHFEQEGDDLLVYIDETGHFTEETFNKDDATQVVKLSDTTLLSTDYEDIMKELIGNDQIKIDH